MKRVLSLLLILISVSLWAEEAKTDTTRAKRKIYKLEGISVIAERPEQSIGNISLKRYNPQEAVMEVDVAEALDDIAGLNLAIGGKSGSELSIRGFSEEQIKILIDGRPLSNSYMDAVDLTSVPLTNIKEIQVLKGPISALYGSDTMGGVVNIITNSPSKKHELVLGTQIRRNNTNKFYANFSQNRGWFDYSISASRYHTDGFVLSEDFDNSPNENGTVRDRNARTQYDIQTKLNFELWDFHKIGLQLGYTNQPLKEIAADTFETNYREFTNWKRYQGSLSAFFQLSDNLEYNGQVYYDQYEDTYVEYTDADFTNLGNGWPSDLESWTFGTHDFVDWQINPQVKITNGIRYEKSLYNRIDKYWYTDWTSNSAQYFNFFLQAEAAKGDFSATISTGISLFTIKSSDEWNEHFQPSAGIYYKSDHNLKLSLASGINTTYPTLRQLYSSNSGNENLVEERAWKNELTIDQPFAFKSISGNIFGSFYYNEISNLIDRVNEVNENLDDAESYGYESTLKLKYYWEHELNYSYLKYTNDEIAQMTGAPENSLSLNESVKTWKGIKLSYKAEWKDERLTENPSVKLDSYWLHSLKIQKNFNRYKLALGLENIFDQNYHSKYRYPGPGRNFIINLEAKI